jgi:hypothetical protein
MRQIPVGAIFMPGIAMRRGIAVRKYRFTFLNRIGQSLGDQVLEAADNDDALELARLLDYAYAIIVTLDDREIGVVRRDKGPPAAFRQAKAASSMRRCA